MIRLRLVAVSALITVVAISGVVPVLAEDISYSGKGLAELAELYEQRAEEQTDLVIEHRAMRKKTQKHLKKSDPGSEEANKYQEMIQHCEGIIESARNLRREYLGLAEWFGENEFPLDY